MGYGRIGDGEFDLLISFRHNASAEQIGQWKCSFKHASRILHGATFGFFRFGRIFWVNGNAGSVEADGYLLPTSGTSYSSINKLGDEGRMRLCADEAIHPYIIVHEFGHYGFGLRDESRGEGSKVSCIGEAKKAQLKACIMEFPFADGMQLNLNGEVASPGTVNRFCTAQTHNSSGEARFTWQHIIHEKSCWETIKEMHHLPDVLPVPAPSQEIEWIEVEAAPRFALVLDSSASMGDTDSIEYVRIGADHWLNLQLEEPITKSGDRLAVISFATEPQTILALELINPSSDLAAARSKIAALEPSGGKNLGGGLQRAVAELLGPDLKRKAATQAIVLFSDGVYDIGINPEVPVETMVEEGIRTFTIGMGENVDLQTLHELATATHGRCKYLDDAAGAQTLQSYLIELSGDLRGGDLIIGPQTLMPGATLSELQASAALRSSVQADPSKLATVPVDFAGSSTRFDSKVLVEEGSDRATFSISYRRGSSLDFYLMRPDGTVVNPATDDGVSLVAPIRMPYATYLIDDPQPGEWIMRVIRGSGSQQVPFDLFAFSENPLLRIDVFGYGRLYQVNQKIKLGLDVTYGTRLGGLPDPTVTIRSVDGHFIASTTMQATGLGLERGIYRVYVQLPSKGAYDVELRLENHGTAAPLDLDHMPQAPASPPTVFPVPPHFVRTRRFQLHVGPLPDGSHNDPQ